MRLTRLSPVVSVALALCLGGCGGSSASQRGPQARTVTVSLEHIPGGFHGYADVYPGGTGIIRISPSAREREWPSIIQHELMHTLGEYAHHEDEGCLLSDVAGMRYYTHPPCAEDLAILDRSDPVHITIGDLQLLEAVTQAVLWLNIWAERELFTVYP